MADWIAGIHPDDRERVRSAFAAAANEGSEFEVEYRKLINGTHWVHVKGRVVRDTENRPVRMVGVAHDITQRKRAEERLREAQKLESIGFLAGGVAHDFNNLLTVIMGNASVALHEYPNHEHVEAILAASERAGILTKQLLAYAGKSRIVTTLVDLT